MHLEPRRGRSVLHAPTSESKAEAGKRRSERAAAVWEHHAHATRTMDPPGAFANQAMLRMGVRPTPQQPSRLGMPQPKCACGGKTPGQPRLAINEPDDAFEREADHVADQVMR